MKRPATLVSWALAPAWVTVDAAAALLGCDVAHVLELVDAGAVDAEEDAGGAWLVDKASLREYQEIREVLADGD